MSAVHIADGTRKVKNIKTGVTSTRPPVTLIIVDLQIAWKHKVLLKCFYVLLTKMVYDTQLLSVMEIQIVMLQYVRL